MTAPRPAIPAGIIAAGVVAIARRPAADALDATVDALIEGGIGAFELTLNEPEAAALDALGVAVRRAEGSTLAVGAGTVLTIEAAQRALDAGATFLVSPHIDIDLVAWAAAHGIPILPGAATPTEVLAAWRAGAAAVKAFPASTLGPNFIRELRGPFPDIPILPTGGVTAANAGEFVEAGAIAVGIGSWLFAGGTPGSIAKRARKAVVAVARAWHTSTSRTGTASAP